ncbi:MAG: hypothetical protein WAK76_02195, partial [Trebonia sp.]
GGIGDQCRGRSYLTASEVFPLEVRAHAGAILGGVVAIFFGVAAEGKALEDVATPLSVVSKPPLTIFRSGVDREGIDPAAP